MSHADGKIEPLPSDRNGRHRTCGEGHVCEGGERIMRAKIVACACVIVLAPAEEGVRVAEQQDVGSTIAVAVLARSLTTLRRTPCGLRDAHVTTMRCDQITPRVLEVAPVGPC